MTHDPLESVGPFDTRRFHSMAVCEAYRSHEHDEDHITIILAGRALVVSHRATGDTEQDCGRGTTVLMLAHVKHTIKPLEPDTEWLCVFLAEKSDVHETIRMEHHRGSPMTL